MIVVAGPPGSGKTSSFPVTAFGVDAFNIDDRCAQVLGSYRAIGRSRRGNHDQERAQSVGFDSVLRQNRPLVEICVRCGFDPEASIELRDAQLESFRGRLRTSSKPK